MECMATLIIEVSGGVVQEVYSDIADVRVIKIDWDAGESPGDAVQAGRLHVANVVDMPSDTRAAVECMR